jgi:hypothetical protein
MDIEIAHANGLGGGHNASGVCREVEKGLWIRHLMEADKGCAESASYLRL